MVAQVRLPIGSIAVVFALQIAILGVAGHAGAAQAADCLAAPGPSTPSNGHWYYRTDPTTQRKCWYLGTVNSGSVGGPSPEQAAKITQSAPASATHSLADFKAFMTHRGMANLSDQDVTRLYAEFLAWRRRSENAVKQHQ
jgi:hypothetical protein